MEKEGYVAQKSMEILTSLGDIYGADKLISISSCQIAGVSYKTIGDAGLFFISEFSKSSKVKVKSTLNPMGMDSSGWQRMGIKKEFAKKQHEIIDAYFKMGIDCSCTCTPYLIGNRPNCGEHIAWSESSAVSLQTLSLVKPREGGLHHCFKHIASPELWPTPLKNRKACCNYMKESFSDVGALKLWLNHKVKSPTLRI